MITGEYRATWFLKTHLQYELLLLFREPDPSKYELQEFINEFAYTFPKANIVELIHDLYQSMRFCDSNVIPPMVYDEMMKYND